MTTEKRSRLTVVSNTDLGTITTQEDTSTKEYHTNTFYEKLLTFRNLQEKQKKRFSVDDLFKLC